VRGLQTSTLTGLSLYTRRGSRETERLQVPVGEGETIAVVGMVKDAPGVPGRERLTQAR
jgi:hypothetical protein